MTQIALEPISEDVESKKFSGGGGGGGLPPDSPRWSAHKCALTHATLAPPPQ